MRGTYVFLFFTLTAATHLSFGFECNSEALKNARIHIWLDQSAIRNLSLGTNTEELDDWASISEGQRRETAKHAMIGAASLILQQGIHVTATKLLEPTNIAGYPLPNGIGSLGKAQRNAIVSKLRLSRGGEDSPVFEWVLSRLSEVNGKKDLFQRLPELSDQLSEALKGIKAADSVEQATALFQVMASLAGKSQFAVAITTEGFNGFENLAYLLLISNAVASLSDATDKQLVALKALNRQLAQDVRAVQFANTQYAACIAKENIEKRHTQLVDGTEAKMPVQVPPDCGYILEWLESNAKGIKHDQGMVEFFQQGQGNREGVENWTKCVQDDLRIRAEELKQLNECIASHPVVEIPRDH